jgi:nicotinate-nucleotide adenylyltransferase
MLTGLFFGSFNPIHTGHLIIASYMVEYGFVDEMWFVISPHNPLKDPNILIDERHRLQMVNLAIGNDKRFRSCDLEFSLPKPSYTIDTLIKLKELYPENQFAIVMGADGLKTFDLWKNSDVIIKNCKRFVYPRLSEKDFANQKVENGTVVAAPLLDISSTFIRKAIKDGKDLHYFVPENVWLYIHRHGLYF